MFVSSVQRLVTSAALFVDARRRLGREDRAGANTISPAFSSFFVVSFVRSVARWLDGRESRCEEEESRRVSLLRLRRNGKMFILFFDNSRYVCQG